MSLVIPLLLVAVACVAQGRARTHYRAGMTGDALIAFAGSMFLMILAGFYLLGYGVALWRS
ncbi:hypothetical protein D3C84_208350 [compost metagenome]|jgi:hypothetical protein